MQDIKLLLLLKYSSKVSNELRCRKSLPVIPVCRVLAVCLFLSILLFSRHYRRESTPGLHRVESQHSCTIFCVHLLYWVFLWSNSPTRARAASFLRFLDHTQWSTTVGRTPLDEGSALRRDPRLTTHTTLTADKHPCPRRDSNPQS